MTHVQTIDTHTAQDWLAHGQATVLDVREEQEWQAGHIAEARLAPLSQGLAEILPEDQGKKLVITCKSGYRSRVMAEALIANGMAWESVYNMVGGFDAWSAAGLPVERGNAVAQIIPLVS